MGAIPGRALGKRSFRPTLRWVSLSRSAALLLLTLSACSGGGKGGGAPGTPSAPAADVPIVTAPGVLLGTAVVQPVDAGGGTVVEPSTGATVMVPTGAFTSATTVTVQPETDTLPNGLGNGVAISTGQAMQKPVVVQFGYGADVADPGSLRIAAQAADGSWRTLSPVGIDPAARTITAALPPSVPLASAASAGPAEGALAAGPLAASPLTSQTVAVVQMCRMAPATATVKATKTVDLLPLCMTGESHVCPELICDPGAPGSCYLDLTQTCLVFEEKPLLNVKAGYLRSWSVNGTVLGDSTVGTITPKDPAGATYTAPALTPSPNPVAVAFQSVLIADPRQKVQPSAAVTVTPDHYHVKVTLAGTAVQVCTFGFAATMDDGYEFDFDGLDGTNFTNQLAALSGVQAYGGGTLTLLGSYDASFAESATGLTSPLGGTVVDVLGQPALNPGCRWDYMGVIQTDPGGPPPPLPVPILEFTYKDTDFGSGNTDALPPIGLGPGLVATVVLTR